MTIRGGPRQAMPRQSWSHFVTGQSTKFAGLERPTGVLNVPGSPDARDEKGRLRARGRPKFPCRHRTILREAQASRGKHIFNAILPPGASNVTI